MMNSGKSGSHDAFPMMTADKSGRCGGNSEVVRRTNQSSAISGRGGVERGSVSPQCVEVWWSECRQGGKRLQSTSIQES